MENPSLRVSGHVSSMNRTFIVEDFAEDDFGQWATDEVTGEQGYIDDESSCFWTWDDTECAWQYIPFKGRQVKRKQGKGKGAIWAQVLLLALSSFHLCVNTFCVGASILSSLALWSLCSILSLCLWIQSPFG